VTTPPLASSSLAVLVTSPAGIGAHGVLSGVAAADVTAVRTGEAVTRGVGDAVEVAPQLTSTSAVTIGAKPKTRLTRP
jgi:hypothetical protein